MEELDKERRYQLPAEKLNLDDVRNQFDPAFVPNHSLCLWELQ